MRVGSFPHRLTAGVFLLLCGHLTYAEESGGSSVNADLVLLNGRIWTGDKRRPEVTALACWRDRILAAGTDAEIKRLATATTKVLDLRGKRVVPGFYDSHVHLLGSGLRLSQVTLKDAPDEAEFGRRLAAFHRKLPRDRWILGGEWDHDRTFGGELPTARTIDKYVSDRPVFIRRYDGHMGLVNSLALRQAGITADTKDPPGGVIYRIPGTNEPSGLLRDNAMALVGRLVPAPSETEIVEAIQAALQEARQEGVTSVVDMDGSDGETRSRHFRLLQQLARSNKLTLRIDLRWPLAEWQELARLGIEHGLGNNWVQIGGVKGFVDGSLGSSTARMFEPFLNEPGNLGVYVTPLNVLRERIMKADRAGIAVAVHAIGDRANAELLDIFADVIRVNGRRDRRFRIEHAQHLRPKDYARFQELGVIASMQPYHAIDDGRWAEGRIGKDRCRSSYAFRSLLSAGAAVAFGSDWSVAPLSPLEGIDAAVNRRTLDGKNPNGWFAEQAITVAEALEAYTLTSAYAAFHEKERGTIEPGKLADLVILSVDILDAANRNRIAGTKVLTTIVGGKTVFDRNE